MLFLTKAALGRGHGGIVMKKFLAGMMALLMTASLAGCSGGDASSTAPQASGENGNSEEEVTLQGEITFSTWGSLAEKEINEEIIAAFEEKYPGTKINLEYIPENYTQKLIPCLWVETHRTLFMGIHIISPHGRSRGC